MTFKFVKIKVNQYLSNVNFLIQRPRFIICIKIFQSFLFRGGFSVTDLVRNTEERHLKLLILWVSVVTIKQWRRQGVRGWGSRTPIPEKK